MNRVIVALCLILMVAFAIAGCGDEEADGGPGPGAYGLQGKDERPVSREEKPKKRLQRASIWRADSKDIKRGLFEFDGFTLYRFDKDRDSTPTCYGACARKWPPLLTEAKPYGVDVVKSELGTTKRKDGTLQVTYFGHPLYTFAGDKVTGDVNGDRVEAFGGTWHALRANGQDAKS